MPNGIGKKPPLCGGGTSRTPSPTILGKCAIKSVGAIQESPADAATIARENQKDRAPTTTVIARAVRPVAIRIPCGAKHRPPPLGAERERIATSLCSSQ